jgi:hypothetical protein
MPHVNPILSQLNNVDASVDVGLGRIVLASSLLLILSVWLLFAVMRRIGSKTWMPLAVLSAGPILALLATLQVNPADRRSLFLPILSISVFVTLGMALALPFLTTLWSCWYGNAPTGFWKPHPVTVCLVLLAVLCFLFTNVYGRHAWDGARLNHSWSNGWPFSFETLTQRSRSAYSPMDERYYTSPRYDPVVVSRWWYPTFDELLTPLVLANLFVGLGAISLSAIAVEVRIRRGVFRTSVSSLFALIGWVGCILAFVLAKVPVEERLLYVCLLGTTFLLLLAWLGLMDVLSYVFRFRHRVLPLRGDGNVEQ